MPASRGSLADAAAATGGGDRRGCRSRRAPPATTASTTRLAREASATTGETRSQLAVSAPSLKMSTSVGRSLPCASRTDVQAASTSEVAPRASAVSRARDTAV